jgi:hypothetical protein
MKAAWDEAAAIAEQTLDDCGYYLFYYSFMRPSFRDFYFDNENEYHVEVIDTWEMTIEDRGIHRGRFRVELPGKEYMAVRIKRKKNGQN